MKHILNKLLVLLIICLLLLLILKYYFPIFEAFENNTWAIVQYDDRELNNNEQELVNINKKYAAAHNYDYIFLKDGYNHLPPYWAKVAAVRDVMKQGKHKGVCWIDTDAVFVNHSKSIEEFCNNEGVREAAFVMAKDPPQWNMDFNAGVWFVRNNSHGNAVMDHWMKCWDAVMNDWTKEGTKWKCSGVWAGPSYEQGAFIENVMKNDDLRGHIAQLSYDFLQTIDWTLPNAFTIHFAGDQKSVIPRFLKSYKSP